MISISKELSANDIGLTGGHQAGMHVPRDPTLISFFPALDPAVRNPRASLLCRDDGGQIWTFAFIYYNNRFFGGTRNEYRLTGMTRFIREAGLHVGDRIIFQRDYERTFQIGFTRNRPKVSENAAIVKLGTSWKVISIER